MKGESACESAMTCCQMLNKYPYKISGFHFYCEFYHHFFSHALVLRAVDTGMLPGTHREYPPGPNDTILGVAQGYDPRLAQQGKWLSTPVSDPSTGQTAAPALAPNIKALASSGFVAFSVLRTVSRDGRRTRHILCGSHTIHLGQSRKMLRSCLLKLGSQK